MRLKTLALIIFEFFFNLLIKSSKKISPKSMLIIRLDGIGDYVLFRNYLELLSQNNKYKGYKITLIGNSSCKPIAEELDKAFVSKFIWINLERFRSSLFYRHKMLSEIALEGYEIVINSTYSREFLRDDAIVKLVTANKKIGSVSDLSNITKRQKKIGDTYYTQLIDAKDGVVFEFNRNKEFFENLLEEKIHIKRPSIVLQPKPLPFNLPDKYAILFIGARYEFRRWAIENFSKVATYLKENCNYEIVICGSPSDSEAVRLFKNTYQYDFIDLVGKTSLIELVHVIERGYLIISNDTSAPHFAVALNVKNIFVITNGNHLGRFTPYPKDITNNYHAIYHPKLEKDGENIEQYFSYGNRSILNLNEISPVQVIEKLKKILKC